MVNWSNVWTNIKSKFNEPVRATTTTRKVWQRDDKSKTKRKKTISQEWIDVKTSFKEDFNRAKKSVSIKWVPPANTVKDINVSKIEVKDTKDIIPAVTESVKRASQTVRNIPAQATRIFGSATGIEQAQSKISEGVMGYSAKELEEAATKKYEDVVKKSVGYDERQDILEQSTTDLERIGTESEARSKVFAEVSAGFEDESTPWEQDISSARAAGFDVKSEIKDGKEVVTISDTTQQREYTNWKKNLESQGFKITENKDGTIDILDVQTETKLKEYEASGQLEDWQKESIKSEKLALAGGASAFYAKTFGKGFVGGAAKVLFPPYGVYLGTRFVTETIADPVGVGSQIIENPGETAAMVGGFVVGSGVTSYTKQKLTEPKLVDIKAKGKLEIFEETPGVFNVKQDVVATYVRPFTGGKTFKVNYEAVGSGAKIGDGYALTGVQITDVASGRNIGAATSITMSKLTDFSSYIYKTVKTTDAGTVTQFLELKPETSKVYTYDSYILSGSKVPRSKFEIGVDKALNIFRTNPKEVIPTAKWTMSKYRATGENVLLEDFTFTNEFFKQEFYTTLPGASMKEFYNYNPMKLFDSSGKLITYGQKPGLYLSDTLIPTSATTMVKTIFTPKETGRTIGTGTVTPKLSWQDVKISDTQVMSFLGSLKKIYGDTGAPTKSAAIPGFVESITKTIPKTQPSNIQVASLSENLIGGSGTVAIEKTRQDDFSKANVIGGKFTAFSDIGKQDNIWKDFQGVFIRDTTRDRTSEKVKQTQNNLNKAIQSLGTGTSSGVDEGQDIGQIVGPIEIPFQDVGQGQIQLQQQTQIQTNIFAGQFNWPGMRWTPGVDIPRKKKGKQKPYKKKKKKIYGTRYSPSFEALLMGQTGPRPRRKISGIQRRPSKVKVDKQLKKLLGL